MFQTKSSLKCKSNSKSVRNISNKYFVKFSLNLQKNEPDCQLSCTQTYLTQRLSIEQSKRKLNQPFSQRDSVEYINTDRTMIWKNVNFRNQLKKYNQEIKELADILREVSHQIAHELQKNKVLRSLIDLIRIQAESKLAYLEHNMINFHTQQKNDLELIQKEKLKLEKVLNEKNKVINQQKILLQKIQNQRKIRIIYENYFHTLEKQIHKHQLLYNFELEKAASNKFLYMMTSKSDIVSNGQILTLKKQDGKENQKQMMMNSYMCLPLQETKNLDEQKETKNKSLKHLGKKGTSQKIVKIMDFIATSKALEISELNLYEQQEVHQKQNRKIFSAFTHKGKFQRTSKIQRNASKSSQKHPISKISKQNQRSGQLISIKLIDDINKSYEGNLDEIVYELFKVYQALGINIFAQKNNQNEGVTAIEDFFNYDEQLLVQQSQRRIEYLKKSEQKMAKFNQSLDKKISLVDENINQTQNFIIQIKKRIKKDEEKEYEEVDQIFQNQVKQNESLYHSIAQLLGINPRNYNSEKEVESLVQKIIETEKQCQNLPQMPQTDEQDLQKQINFSNKVSRESLPTFKTFLDTKNNIYIHQNVKTQGNQRKFHPLIKSKGDTLNQNKSCRSIFLNGMKSLDNIFDNMKTVQSYQRVFERAQFESEYSKEITRKKRVMFRREAQVMPGNLN